MSEEIIALKARVRELSQMVQDLQYQKEMQAATIESLNDLIRRLAPPVLRVVYNGRE